MNTNFDKNAISLLLNDFHNATGLSIDLKDASFNEIGRSNNDFNCFCKNIQASSAGAARCYASDIELFKKCNLSGKPEIHTCHAGLTDMAVPIIFNNKTVAYVILGQIKNDLDIEEILNRLGSLNVDRESVKVNYQSLPIFSDEKINSIVNIAVMLAEHILFKNLIDSSLDDHTQKAVEYINEHIGEGIEVNDICVALNISKSLIYKKFDKQFGLPPKKYINLRKIEKAKWQLKHTDNSVESIAVALGFENTGYFYRIFKNITGMTPLQYKNDND